MDRGPSVGARPEGVVENIRLSSRTVRTLRVTADRTDWSNANRVVFRSIDHSHKTTMVEKTARLAT